MTRPPGQALKEAENRAKAAQKQLDRLRKSWVAGSEMTPQELALVQPGLKRACAERHPEWFGKETV